MPAMDFPSSPTNGQVFGAYTYDSTKGAWRVMGVQATSVISSATPPSSPTAGNLWFNTNDGVLFTYFDDGNTSQWVEVKSNTASGSTVAARVDALEAKPAGLVAMIPTSVETITSGTASVNSTGLITFNGTQGIRINGAITSAYKMFRVTLSSTMSATEVLNFRWRVAGGDRADTYYGASYSVAYNAALATARQYNNNSIGFVSYHGASGGNITTMDLLPLTTYSSYTYSTFGTDPAQTMGGGYHTPTPTRPDGITLFPATAGVTFSGTISVYGYR